MKERNETQKSEEVLVPLETLSINEANLVGGKNINLAILTQNGLPVPKGFAVKSTVHDEYIKTGRIAPSLVDHIIMIKEALGGQIAIRSSANIEDNMSLSMSGVFSTFYVRNGFSHLEIEAAVKGIYDQSHSPEVVSYLTQHGISINEIKMGLVIQELIEPNQAGVLYTRVNRSEDEFLLQYTDGFGDRMVNGETLGSSLIFDIQTGQIKSSANFESIPISQETLLALVNCGKQIRGIYGFPQDVEFAIRDAEVFVLQTRPMTSEVRDIELKETASQTLKKTKEQIQKIIDSEKALLGTPYCILTDSNFSELMPQPKEMDIGVFAYIFSGRNGIPGGIQIGRENMGYSMAGESTGYMFYIGGRPYTSEAMSSANFYIGFPDSSEEYYQGLVTEYVTKMQANPELAQYAGMSVYLQDPTQKDLEVRFGEKAVEYYQIYLDFKERMSRYADVFKHEYLDKKLPISLEFINIQKEVELSELSNPEIVYYIINIFEHLRTESCVDFVTSARLGFYYSQKMKNDLLRFMDGDTKKAEEAFARLSQGLSGSMTTDVNIELTNAESDEEALKMASNLVGHYSLGEMLEIRHPRYSTSRQGLVNYVQGIRESNYAESFEKQKAYREAFEKELLDQVPPEERIEFIHTMKSAQTYMALRETVKYFFGKEYALARNGLELLEERLELPKGSIYSLYPDELYELVENPQSYLHIIKSRQQAFENYAHLRMPHVIRDIDIENISLNTEEGYEFSELEGTFLAEGDTFDGVVLNIDEFETQEELLQKFSELSQQNQGKIVLCATQMNLSHDPFIMKAKGLILENAGIVSHGAQRARELGRGAIGGIQTRYLKTGQKINFDPGNRKIKKIDK